MGTNCLKNLLPFVWFIFIFFKRVKWRLMCWGVNDDAHIVVGRKEYEVEAGADVTYSAGALMY